MLDTTVQFNPVWRRPKEVKNGMMTCRRSRPDMPRHCYVHTDTDIRLSIYLHYTIACLFGPILYGYSILFYWWARELRTSPGICYARRCETRRGPQSLSLRANKHGHGTRTLTKTDKTDRLILRRCVIHFGIKVYIIMTCHWTPTHRYWYWLLHRWLDGDSVMAAATNWTNQTVCQFVSLPLD